MNILVTLLLVCITSLHYIQGAAVDTQNAGPVIIFDPPPSWTNSKTASARTLLLKDNSILATFDANVPIGIQPYFPIYRSTDNGQSWLEVSRVYDQADHGALRWEACFLLLDDDTILLAGNAVPDNHKTTNLDLYASNDGGLHWVYRGTIASGGMAEPINTEHPVWEPNLIMKDGTLYCFYSDQRHVKGQQIVHAVSHDLGFIWSKPVIDVPTDGEGSRPGMPNVEEQKGGPYIMTYELLDSKHAGFRVFYKLADNLDGFAHVQGTEMVATSGNKLESSPWCVWTPAGGVKGTTVISAASNNNLFINLDYGRGEWTMVPSLAPKAYSRSVEVGRDQEEIMIASAGEPMVTFTLTNVVRT